MSDLPPSPAATWPAPPPEGPAATAAPAGAPAVPPQTSPGQTSPVQIALLVVLALLAVAALLLAWYGQQRIRTLELELVRRQQDSGTLATEAKLLAKQAQEWSQEASAKAALLEQRVAEVSLQRSQLDDLMQSLSRSREENVVSDIGAGLRVALQQSAITGSAEPLVAALKAADERLERENEPRLEAVRRAIARDLDRVKAVAVADLASLAIKLDEAVRLVDEAPLMVMDAARESALSGAAVAAPAAASAPTARAAWPAGARDWWAAVWGEARGLLRVSRIDRPEAMLLAPEQGFFLRENLKLKLLNARLALLSRQFDIAQADLQASLASLGRYFDASARKTVVLEELLRSVAAQGQQAGLPRPDDTLAALETLAVGR